MGSIVEAELAFLEKQREVLAWNIVLLTQYALGLVPEVLNAVDVVEVTSKFPGVIDAHAVELTDVKRVVAAEAVGVDNTVRGYIWLMT